MPNGSMGLWSKKRSIGLWSKTFHGTLAKTVQYDAGIYRYRISQTFTFGAKRYSGVAISIVL